MLATSFLSKCSHKESSFFLHIIYLRRTVFLFVENTYTQTYVYAICIHLERRDYTVYTMKKNTKTACC